MRLLLLTFAFVLAGCGSSTLLGEPIQNAPSLRAAEGLIDVNEAMKKGQLRLYLSYGSRKSATSVFVGAENVRYTVSGVGDRYVATANVDSVVALTGGRAGKHALYGAAPGLAVLSGALVFGAISGDPCGGSSQVCIPAAAFVGAIGAAIAVGGAVFGGLVGLARGPSGREVLYVGPVERYF